jgi:selenocysteine-specific elongation factor
VIAADEGIMPQTREHLAILDLLRVPRGVVALTKADLVDEDWIEMVREEVAETLLPTTLSGSAIIPFSAYTGQGLPELVNELERLLDEAQERHNIARPRLPIDRVFTMTGFGTVVTGTLLDGTFRTGQEVEALPQGIKTRIRALQTHRHAVEAAHPGSRVAINLANVSRSDLQRGDVITLPGQFQPTMLIDARVQLLPDAARPLGHNTLVDFYTGSQEVPASVRLLDRDEVQPGEGAWAQLRLSRPAVMARRDRFILRIPSPSMTIGGGEVIDTHPRYHRRSQAAVLSRLETLERGTPEELVLAALDRRRETAKAGRGQTGGKPGRGKAGQTKGDKPAPLPYTKLSGYELEEVVKQSGLGQDVTRQALETLLQERRVRQVGIYWFAQAVWEALREETIRLLREQHERYPLRNGLAKEEWRSRLGLPPRMANDVLAAFQEEGAVAEASGITSAAGSVLRLPDFSPAFTSQQQERVQQLLHQFHEHPFTPPGRAEAEALVGSEVLGALIEQGTLVKVGSAAEAVLFLRESYDQALATLLAYVREHGKMTAAEARDALGTTRKYILPLLEHMDERRLTRRVGDERVAGSAMTQS